MTNESSRSSIGEIPANGGFEGDDRNRTGGSSRSSSQRKPLQMEVFVKGWLVTLADGRRFSWVETDGVHSEREARTLMLQTVPNAQIESVEEEEIVLNVSLSEN